MSFQLNLPPSAIAAMAKKEESLEEAGTSTGKRREDYKKLKELEEARKAGTAPAMQDEEGKDINPHIPQYIMQAPWYYQTTTPTLKHQRPMEEHQKQFDGMGKWYKKGQKEGPVATRFRKGACENCGAMTHKKKDCLERPRKLGAKFTGSEIAPDEYIQEDLQFDYEGKRDRWNGYDEEHYKQIAEDYAKIEEAKRILKAQKIDSGIASEEKEEQIKDEDEDEDDEDKYADDLDMPGSKFVTKERITVRNLRIREDTAKYLINLDVNSAHYDPKTRSMRQNPYAGTGQKDAEEMYAGDNFVRMSGDAKNYAERQLFAWQAYEKGTDVHLQADPTKLELLSRDYKRKKTEYKDQVKQDILDRYGGEEHLEAPPKQLLMAQSENYVEYSRHGTVIKGQERAKTKSIYEEDVHINNHTSVWGSYWREGKWGYKCCYSIVKESYCTGQAGRESVQEAIEHREKALEAQKASIAQAEPKPGTSAEGGPLSQPKFNTFDVGCTNEAHKAAAKRTLEAYANMKKLAQQEKDGKKEKEDTASETEDEKLKREKRKRRKDKKKQKKKERKMKRRKKSKKKKVSSSSSSSDSSSSESEDEDAVKERKVKEAMKKEDARIKEVDHLMTLDERKRPYNSMCDAKAPTEEELEAYRRRQKHFEDPMAQFM